MTRSIVIISAALSEASSTTLLGERLAERAQKAAHEPFEITTIELRDYFKDIAQAYTAFAPERLREVFEQVAAADGIIAVTPIYNTSYSGLFKSFFDVLPENSLQDVPVLIGATGGTPRHSLALDYAIRPMMSYLKAYTLTTGVYAATDDWGANSDDVRSLPDRIDAAGWQLAEAVSVRSPRATVDEFHATPSFDDLMKGLGKK